MDLGDHCVDASNGFAGAKLHWQLNVDDHTIVVVIDEEATTSDELLNIVFCDTCTIINNDYKWK